MFDRLKKAIFRAVSRMFDATLLRAARFIRFSGAMVVVVAGITAFAINPFGHGPFLWAVIQVSVIIIVMLARIGL